MKTGDSQGADYSYLPEFINLQTSEGWQRFTHLSKQGVQLLDVFSLQKKELIKTRNPGKKLTGQDLEELYKSWLADREELKEGIWIFYPWVNKIVHTLVREEFIELRTNRNQYKISPDEQQQLAEKTIGIIGLSVGHAVAVCMASERVCGKLKLADFDDLELSNLNRIKTSIFNLGINKCISTAREIAEIDPFIEIECFPEGITEENMQQFLNGGSKLDVLVDECDGLDIKIRCRQEAKKLHIPVVMETSDNGMLDVERFDLEPERPILHGLLEGIPLDNLKHATNEQKIPIILRIADVRKGSLRAKVSMLEVGQSISTWPQLASAVTLGGGVVTDVCRRILLNHYHESGRYYVNLENLVGNTKPRSGDYTTQNPHEPFELEAVDTDTLEKSLSNTRPDEKAVETMVEAACLAPSAGNDQPWKWVYDKGLLYLFHDVFRSHSFGDYDNISALAALGAAYENLALKANQMGWNVHRSMFPQADNPRLIATITFTDKTHSTQPTYLFSPSLVSFIESRCTNRNPSEVVEIPASDIALLTEAVTSVSGASLHCFSDRQQMLALGKVVGECDRIKLLNADGHKDFVERELRWTVEEASSKRDGIDIRTLGLNGALMSVLALIKDREVAAELKQIKGGKTLVDAAMMTSHTASMMGIITLPRYSREHFFEGGIAMQRLWLKATELNYALHPLISPLQLFPRLQKGEGQGLDEGEISKLKEARKLFESIVPVGPEEAEIFMFKIAKAAAPAVKSLRLPLSETLFVLGNN